MFVKKLLLREDVFAVTTDETPLEYDAGTSCAAPIADRARILMTHVPENRWTDVEWLRNECNADISTCAAKCLTKVKSRTRGYQRVLAAVEDV